MSPPARALLALTAAALLHAACAVTAGGNNGIPLRNWDVPRHDDGITRLGGKIARRNGLCCPDDVDTNHCTSVLIGRIGILPVNGFHTHIAEKEKFVDIPQSSCPFGMHEVGRTIKVCDPYGTPPKVTPLDNGNRVSVACDWTPPYYCSGGLDLNVVEYCDYLP